MVQLQVGVLNCAGDHGSPAPATDAPDPGASACSAERAGPPALPPQAALDHARSASSTRNGALKPATLTSWFSNLPDVELRPGTALVPGQQHGSGGCRTPRDPALAVTHVSLADMPPALFMPQTDEAAEPPARPHVAPVQVGPPATVRLRWTLRLLWIARACEGDASAAALCAWASPAHVS